MAASIEAGLKSATLSRGGVWMVINGEPASKANSRRIIWAPGKSGKRVPRSIKSEKALRFVSGIEDSNPQDVYAPLGPILGEDVTMVCLIKYASRRPDMDESLILDGLQGILYDNDRQVRLRITASALDPGRPGAFVYCEPLARSLESGLPGFGQPIQSHC